MVRLRGDSKRDATSENVQREWQWEALPSLIRPVGNGTEEARRIVDARHWPLPFP